MTLAELSIKKPVFITSALLLSIISGLFFMRDIGVSLYPDVSYTSITVATPYPGAGPEDIESRITKPLEDSISATAGLKKMTSQSNDGISIITVEFTLETNPAFALQQVRDKVSAVRSDLPQGIPEPTVSILNMDDMPILTFALSGNMSDTALSDLAEYTVLPRLQQSKNVGRVEMQGARKRELKVELDRQRLATYEISASEAATALAESGRNVSAGKKDSGGKGRYYRVMGEFKNPADVDGTIVRFSGNDIPVRIKELGRTVESHAEEKMLAYRNGTRTVGIAVYKQSRSNTMQVASEAKKAVTKLQKELATLPGNPKLELVQDGTRGITTNVDDVKETIFISIGLTVVVVLLFLRNWRSTIITALAIPNSLIGAIALMYLAGFTINIMSLLALSLSVGLLVDDAIVVRENIFRRLQNGESPFDAARFGTEEVRLAVIATSMTVAAVFLPIAFMKGMIGQYFKEFGITVAFVLLISTLDSLTIAPMLSAYFSKAAGKEEKKAKTGAAMRLYERGLRIAISRPVITLIAGAAIFGLSIWAATRIPSMFLPASENGEFTVNLEGAPDLNLQGMAKKALEVEKHIRSNSMVRNTFLTVGTWDGEMNRAAIFVELKPVKERKVSTTKAQGIFREELKKYPDMNPVFTDENQDANARPINIILMGDNGPALRTFASAFYEKFRNHPALTDPQLSEKAGKPESRIVFDPDRTKASGVLLATAGKELRIQLEGEKVSTLRENGREYDIRLRMEEPDRDLAKQFGEILVPNINGRLIKLPRLAGLEESRSPKSINRMNRSRYISFNAGLAPKGPGMQAFIDDMNAALSGPLKPPEGIRVASDGDTEYYRELLENVAVALLLGICFIYLVLASLYESFTAPFAILLVLPLAASGALLTLWAGGLTMDIYSIIGCILLLGIAAKNSILLVDRIRLHLERGASLGRAIFKAARTRIRPILMTSDALVAGMAAVAAGLNEASAQRVGMGWAVIGGIVSSTAMSLFIVPAAYALTFKIRKYFTGKFHSRPETATRQTQEKA